MPSFFELAVIAFVVCGIAYAVFRQGQANPEGTGKIGKELSALKEDVAAIKGTVDGVEKDVKSVNGKVNLLDRKVTEIERASVTADDIAMLRELIEAKHEARGERISSIQSDVSIIKNFLIEKGLGGR